MKPAYYFKIYLVPRPGAVAPSEFPGAQACIAFELADALKWATDAFPNFEATGIFREDPAVSVDLVGVKRG